MRGIMLAVAVAVAGCGSSEEHHPTLEEEGLPQVETSETQARITPAIALERLQHGNERFLSGETLNHDLRAQVALTAGGQFPFASVVSCIDSRSSPELIFDVGLGDIFSARVAGNIINEDIIGSLEFGSRVAGSRLIVILGHTSCGAVKGACDGAKLGYLTQLLEKIRPAVDLVEETGDRSSKNIGFVDRVAEENVRKAMRRLLERSAVLKQMADEGKIRVVGGMLDVHTGKVKWLQ